MKTLMFMQSRQQKDHHLPLNCLKNTLAKFTYPNFGSQVLSGCDELSFALKCFTVSSFLLTTFIGTFVEVFVS